MSDLASSSPIIATAQWILNRYPDAPITRKNGSLVAVDIVNVGTSRLGLPERSLMDPDPQVTDLVRVALLWFATGVPWNSETPFQDEAATAVGRYIRELCNGQRPRSPAWQLTTPLRMCSDYHEHR